MRESESERERAREGRVEAVAPNLYGYSLERERVRLPAQDSPFFFPSRVEI